MKYKLIATDVDGTLLNKEHKISKENFDAIKKALDSGMLLSLCSGRTSVSLNVFAKELGINVKGAYGIGFNGGIIYEADSLKIIHETKLDNNIALEIIRDVKAVGANVLTPVYSEADTIIIDAPVEVMSEFGDEIAVKFKQISSFEQALTKPVYKILVRGERSELEKVSEAMKDKGEGKFVMVYTALRILEFLPIGVNKGAALGILANYLNISLEEVVSVGDNYNDIELIEQAGFGVAVANAVEPLKNVADYITKNDNNNSAIAEVIEIIA